MLSEYGLVEYFFTASQPGWLVSSDRTYAPNLQQLPILVVYSHAGQPEIRNFAKKTQPHGLACSRDAGGANELL